MELQVAQHEAFQLREWTAQRVGWALTALLLVLASLRVLGSGPLSWPAQS